LYYFDDGSTGKMHIAQSRDGVVWGNLKEEAFFAKVGDWKFIRDPAVVRGDDGTFHAVWTTGSHGFGYASSSDGLNFGEPRYVRVDDPERGYEFVNVWAPALYHEDGLFYIIWSSTLKEHYAPPPEDEKEKWWLSTWNHRFYYTTTTDFETFAPTKPYWDPGHNTIDAELFKIDGEYILIYKDERPDAKNLLTARGSNPLGPFFERVPDVTKKWTEGATLITLPDKHLLYFDYHWENNGYQYRETKDFKTFSEAKDPIKAKGLDRVLRHGSIVAVAPAALDALLEAAKDKGKTEQ
jgi:hypothetical protein